MTDSSHNTHLKIALAQLNPTVGAVIKNAEKAFKAITDSFNKGADLIVFPECFLSGYPAEDLVLKPAFLDLIETELDALITKTAELDIGVVMTAPLCINKDTQGQKRYNSLILFHQGKTIGAYFKHHLPNEGVFDEVRVFDRGVYGDIFEFKGLKIGPQICEDIWHADGAKHYANKGADIIISPNASPYETIKLGKREKITQERVTETGLPLIYLNQIGGQDDLVFDGHSFILNGDGEKIIQLPAFQESLFISDWQRADSGTWYCTNKDDTSDEISRARNIVDKESDAYLESLYGALVLGVRDYVNKNGFSGVILGLSGGLDSALCAAIAADALGSERVKAYMMPSPYTSESSLDDAKECAEALDVAYESISIEPAMASFETSLDFVLDKKNPGVAQENIQSRARGLILMAISNQTGWMVLTTGNKSEYAVGYATLYGDMCGGFAAIKDVYKTTAFKLCEWRNKNKNDLFLCDNLSVIPQNIIDKPPSAELRPDQKDEDSLPPYPILDGILRGLIEHELSLDDLIAQGFEKKTILDVWKLLDRAEYKRRQAAPGTKLTDKAFGRERRYPITNGFLSAITSNQ